MKSENESENENENENESENEWKWKWRERRNHCLTYESDCLITGISIKIWIVEGFESCSLWYFVIHAAIQLKNSFLEQKLSIPICLSYENCKSPRGNYAPKLICNFHISLQFSYQFAIFISVCNSQFLVYGSYMDVCNFHMGLQFSY